MVSHEELTLELNVDDVLAVGIAHVCCCEFMWAVHALGGCSMQNLLPAIGINLTVRLEQMCPSNLLTGDADCVCQWIEVGLQLHTKGTGYDRHGRHSGCSRQDRYSRRGVHSGHGGLGGDIGCDGP